MCKIFERTGQIGSLIAGSQKEPDNQKHFEFPRKREEKPKNGGQNGEAINGWFPAITVLLKIWRNKNGKLGGFAHRDESAHQTTNQIAQ
jgi:hypothetical protein